LDWCAISEAGVSTPFLETVKGQTIDADVYITKSLPKIIKFIKKHHPQKSRNNLLVRSYQHAKKTLEWLEQKSIKIFPKADNLIHVPQARPIEHFWALLACAVYAKG
jgi:hypothetical protein